MNPEAIAELETRLHNHLPAGSNLVALGTTTALWPMLLVAPDVCQSSG